MCIRDRKNPLAIEFIVREYGALVKNVIDRYLRGNRQASEECFNDVLLAIWNYGGTFDDKKSTFKNWLCAIAKYRAIDTLRREAKHRERFLSFDEESSIDWLETVSYTHLDVYKRQGAGRGRRKRCPGF